MATLVEDGLYDLLSRCARITAIVSTRIYRGAAPQSASFPFLVFMRTSGDHVQSLGGSSGLCIAGFDFHCWARAYDTMASLAEAVRLHLQGLKGQHAGLDIQGILFDSGETDIPQGPPESGDVWIYRRIVPATISYSEPQPTL